MLMKNTEQREKEGEKDERGEMESVRHTHPPEARVVRTLGTR